MPANVYTDKPAIEAEELGQDSHLAVNRATRFCPNNRRIAREHFTKFNEALLRSDIVHCTTYRPHG
jgi:hypothetical protein